MPSQKEALNFATPATLDAKLGTKLNDVITLINQLRTSVNRYNDAIEGICDKLDLDGTVTDTNYAALWGNAGSEDNAAGADVTAGAVGTISS